MRSQEPTEGKRRAANERKRSDNSDNTLAVVLRGDFQPTQHFFSADEFHEAVHEAVRAEAARQAAPEARALSTRARIDAFITRVLDTGEKINRTDIWKVAGYKDRTEFQRYQRDDSSTNASAKISFDRVLKMEPQEFRRALQNVRARSK